MRSLSQIKLGFFLRTTHQSVGVGVILDQNFLWLTTGLINSLLLWREHHAVVEGVLLLCQSWWLHLLPINLLWNVPGVLKAFHNFKCNITPIPAFLETCCSHQIYKEWIFPKQQLKGWAVHFLSLCFSQQNVGFKITCKSFYSVSITFNAMS